MKYQIYCIFHYKYIVSPVPIYHTIMPIHLGTCPRSPRSPFCDAKLCGCRRRDQATMYVLLSAVVAAINNRTLRLAPCDSTMVEEELKTLKLKVLEMPIGKKEAIIANYGSDPKELWHAYGTILKRSYTNGF